MKFLLISLLLGVAPAHAVEVIRGALTQGGFVIARTTPGAQVQFKGDTVPVGKDGVFVIGFDRHEPAEATVTVTLPNGTRSAHSWIVAPRTYQVQHVRGVAPKHVNPDPAQVKRAAEDSRHINAAREVFADLPHLSATFTWPVSATISGVYGSSRTFNGEERSWHKGVDIAAPTGTPIIAPAAGVVRLALADSFFNGNLVILDHGHQFYTFYAHLDRLDVKTGQTVRMGDRLGTVGATGRATGPHLHWGLYWRKVALDPMLLMMDGGSDGS
jgi:murein DD-endopeptidase MepM/ murein hydrolase activator NlpD